VAAGALALAAFFFAASASDAAPPAIKVSSKAQASDLAWGIADS
jgi:hypothetical protein